MYILTYIYVCIFNLHLQRNPLFFKIGNNKIFSIPWDGLLLHQ